jgi:pyruvate kinase
VGNAKGFSINFPEILQGLEKGAEIYLDDGLVKLEVVKKEKDGVLAKVIIGGQIRSRVGFSAQGLKLNKFFLTPKDKEDIKTMLEAGADAIAISFVQTAKDVEMVKKMLPAAKRPMLVAKIETQAGVENVEKILDTADAIMVARGDLGLAVPLPEMPHIQKHLIKLALKHAKPVITATQMLESMTYSHMPTRAEVTDVANAILDGTDAVMLSGETARGKYPHEAIRIMRKIIERTTAELARGDFSEDDSIPDAVSASAAKIADQIKARLIIVFTQTGSTARRIARHHHCQPILALSPSSSTIHELNFSWGVYPQEAAITENVDDLIKVAKKVAENNPVVKLKKGEPFVISAGIPFGKSGTTNLVLIQKI